MIAVCGTETPSHGAFVPRAAITGPGGAMDAVREDGAMARWRRPHRPTLSSVLPTAVAPAVLVGGAALIAGAIADKGLGSVILFGPPVLAATALLGRMACVGVFYGDRGIRV